MITTEPRQIARTLPTDDAVSKFGIELSHAAGPVCQGLRNSIRGTEARSRHSRTPAVIAASAERSLATPSTSSAETTRPMVAHSSEAQPLSPYRGNRAFRLAMFCAPCHYTLRGPPGSSRNPRDAQQDANEQCNVDPEIPALTELPLLLSGSGDSTLSVVRRR